MAFREPSTTIDCSSTRRTTWFAKCSTQDGEAYPLLGQFPCPLILAVSQQFNDAFLIRREARDFLDDFAHEGRALGKMTFASRDAGLAFDRCGFLYER